MVWLSLDERDVDITYFLRHLEDTFRKKLPRFDFYTTDLLPFAARNDFVHMALWALIKAMGRRRFILILDDVHAISDGAVMDFLTRLAKSCPPSLTLVMAGRHELWSGLFRLKMDGKIAEITKTDLRFNREEAEKLWGFFDEAAYGVTEGWALALQSYTVTRRPPDTTPPVLTLPGDMVVEPTFSYGTNIPLPIYACDAEDGNVPITVTGDGVPLHTEWAFFGIKRTEVRVTAEDSSGNRAEGTFYVTVKDSTPSSIVVRNNKDNTEIGNSVVVNASSAQDLVFNYTVRAYDSHDGFSTTVTASRPSGSTYPIGHTPVTITARDKFGNLAVKTFTVIVVGPIITDKVITAATPLGDITVPFGTARENIGLPEKVQVDYLAAPSKVLIRILLQKHSQW